MKISLYLVIFYSFIILFNSCQKSANDNFETAYEASPTELDLPASTSKANSPGLVNAANSINAQEQIADDKHKTFDKVSRIIKDGSLLIEVTKIEEAKASVDNLVKQSNGYYEVDTYNATEYQSKYDIKIRIKNDKFDQLTNQLLTIDGVVKHKDINARDVTEEYLDTESRLNSSQSYLKRYQELLGRAISIKDVIEIETKIQEIQINIDVYAGKLKYMNDRINYSTLSLTLTQNHEFYNAKHKDNFLVKMWHAFKTGIDFLLELILGILKIWPLLVLAGLIWYYRKRIFVKKANFEK